MSRPLRVLGGVWRAVVHRAAADRVVLAAAFVTILLATTLLSAGPIYASAVTSNGLQRSLKDAPTAQSNLELSRPVSADRYQEVDSRITAAVGDVFRSTGATVSRSARSGTFALPGQEGVRDLAVFGFFEGIEQHAVIRAGGWPGDGPIEGEVPVAVPTPTAAAIGAKIGDTLVLTGRLGGGEVAVRIVGTYEVEDVGSVYWWGDQLETEGVSPGSSYTVHGPFVVPRSVFFSLIQTDRATARWRVAPNFDRMTVGVLDPLRRGLTGLDDRIDRGESPNRAVRIDTGLPDLLERAQRSLLVARSGVLIATVQLALLAAYALLFTAGLVIEQRRVETALLRARGAAPGQVAAMALLEGLMLAVPAILVAPPLAALAVRIMVEVGPLAEIGLQLAPQITPDVYLLATVTALACVAALVVPTLSSARSYIEARAVTGRESGPGFARRTGLDLALLAVAGLGYWQLRHYGAPITRSVQGTLGLDPFLVLAPTIGLLAGAVVTLRVVPLLAGAAERVATVRSGLVGSLGAWQLSRRPGRHTRAVLMLVLALAIGLFAASYAHTWSRSQDEQAAHQVGADLAVVPDQRSGAALSALTHGTAYRSIDGVHAAMPVLRRSVRIVGNQPSELVAVDARTAPRIAELRPDLADVPAEGLFDPLAERRPQLDGIELPEGVTQVRATVTLATSAPIRGVYEAGQQPVVLIVRDADGVISRVRSEPFLPDGSPHELTFPLTERTGVQLAADPLEVVGLEVGIVPPVGAAVDATVTIDGAVAVVDGTSTTLRLGAVGWTSAAGRLVNAVELPEVDIATSADAVTVHATTGAVPARTNTPVSFRLGVTGDGTGSIPAIANRAYLDALGAAPGDTWTVDVGRARVPVEFVATVEAFPTIDPATPTLVLDYASLAAIQYLRDGSTLTPDTWWLEVDDREVGEIHERLEGRPFSSREVHDRFARADSLRSDPVALGVIGALELGFVAATLFAAIGFGVGAVVSARERSAEFSLLRAVGLSPRQLTSWLSLENGSIVGFSVIAGTALGLALSWLILPLVSLTPDAAPAVPTPTVIVPWATLLRIELLLVAVLAGVVFVVTRLLRRVVLASALRFGEER